jgi:nucleoside-diphosphate-sugar epimerase
MKSIVVTGGSGRAGRSIIPELQSAGYTVRNVDQRPSEGGGRLFRADLEDLGQTVAALQGADAVVHMAAIPSPGGHPHAVVFRLNVMSTWNVLDAAEMLGIEKLVLASSVNAVGLSYSQHRIEPASFPVDENQPARPEESYSISKWVGEQMADAFARKRRVQIASFRFHGLWDTSQRTRQGPPETDPEPGAKHLWAYLDLRDAARACRMALEADWQGHEAFFLTAADTTLDLPTEEAIARCYPGVPLRRELPGFASAFDISKAERLFGWRPQFSWRRPGGGDEGVRG